uniref:Uncharacterized protein n=1 Tax=Anguilla anguilla TaxID=7936 RepID=A0A0E9QYQ2_ANGAN
MVCFKALSRILGFSRIAQGRSHVSLQISPFADRLCVLLLFIFLQDNSNPRSKIPHSQNYFCSMSKKKRMQRCFFMLLSEWLN